MFQRRLCCLLFSALLGAMTLYAQKELHIAPLFQGELIAPTAKVETIAKNRQIAAYHLNLFHSIRCTLDAAALLPLERLVRADATAAVEKEIELREGRLHYALLRLPPLQKKQRYLCYQRNATGALIVYMEGTASLEQLKRMFSK